MSDTTPTSAPSAPAAAPAPTTGAPPEAMPQHHAHRQPREQGRFSGPPGEAAPADPKPPEAAQPPAPKKWRVGDREIEDPDDLYVLAAAKEVERERLEQLAREAEELRAFRAQVQKNKRAVFTTPEEETQHALTIIRERMEWEAMTPEQRALKERERKLEEMERRIREHEERQQQEQQQVALTQAKKQVVATVQAAMDASGLPQTDELARRVARKMHANARLGLNYPPEVLARQVKQEWQEETRVGLEKVPPTQLLDMLPFLVERLESVDDPAILRKLSKLGEKLRRLNLESLGAAPAGAPPAPQPSAPANASGNPKPQEEWTAADWEEEFRRRARG